MATMHPLPPSAYSLSLSLRDLGYSLETAVADIVDNSIAAEATNIHIICDMYSDTPSFAILDDGWGMSKEELLLAMRHGAVTPESERRPTDLGRFGLGLKTASFSQCRQLTVISLKNGVLCGAEWDLDTIKKQDEWTIALLEPEDIVCVPHIEKMQNNPQGSGTLVLWRKMDRLFEQEQKYTHNERINEKLTILRNHLEFVFHRFIDGEFLGGKKLSLFVNNHLLEAFDPFCKKSDPQALPAENIYLHDQCIKIKPYILPYYSRLSAVDQERYKDRSDFLSNQGAYVYRNGRLMAWGDWFRLTSKGEATKLCRVQIDFPSSLDSFWTIDIKKSHARPPQCVRNRLWQILPKIAEGSKKVIRRRGRADIAETKAPFWDRFESYDNITYSINRDHPLIAGFLEKLGPQEQKALDIILHSVASALPVTSIYSDHATQPQLIERELLSDEDTWSRLKDIHSVFFGNSNNREQFLDVIHSMPRVFAGKESLVRRYIEEEML